MKLLIALFVLVLAMPSLATNAKKKLPGYNASAETVYKGKVEDIRDRQCPVSGGIGSHIIMKLEDGTTIEVHMATAEFTRTVEMNIHKGDSIEVTGWKTEFEGVQTIFAREVKHGNDTFVFRAKDGTPAWIY
jgi:TusA-related sulfurtransferase